jgi:hypothetical protein
LSRKKLKKVSKRKSFLKKSLHFFKKVVYFYYMKITLSKTTKMPCYSWNLPALKACPAAQLSFKLLGEDSICSQCYATKGFYAMYQTVKDALQARFDFVLNSIKNDNGETFVKTMVNLIQKAVKKQKENIFRLHDSGDLFSKAYIKTWISICKALPEVRFWIPTREWIRSSDELKELASLPNVALRPSALKFNDLPPKVEGFASGSTVVDSLEKAKELNCFACPATIKGNPKTCDGNRCRACFCVSARKSIAYIKH